MHIISIYVLSNISDEFPISNNEMKAYKLHTDDTRG